MKFTNFFIPAVTLAGIAHASVPDVTLVNMRINLEDSCDAPAFFSTPYVIADTCLPQGGDISIFGSCSAGQLQYHSGDTCNNNLFNFPFQCTNIFDLIGSGAGASQGEDTPTLNLGFACMTLRADQIVQVSYLTTACSSEDTIDVPATDISNSYYQVLNTCLIPPGLGGVSSFKYKVTYNATTDELTTDYYLGDSCSGTPSFSDVGKLNKCEATDSNFGRRMLADGFREMLFPDSPRALSGGGVIFKPAVAGVTPNENAPEVNIADLEDDAPTGGGVCFHKDTEITYQGEKFNMEQLREHEACAIPHIVTERGVVIEASCAGDSKTLRLTKGHLVYTNSGMKAASDVTTDDMVFADIAETKECQVTKISQESSTQTYFGLNCVVSEVLASGIKTSTFEKLHSLPSFWMQLAGNTIGIKYASLIGDKVAALALSIFPNLEVFRW